MKRQSWIGMVMVFGSAFLLFGAVFLAFAGSPAWAASSTVVIAEFRTRGPSGLSDEFVELYNKSNASVDIGQWNVKRSSSTGAVVNVAQIATGTILAAGQHYLLVHASYSGTVMGDLTYTAGIADNGGIGLLDQAGQLIDAVGMSSGSAYLELTPLAPMTATVNQSYERRPGSPGLPDQDTDDNSADFRQNYGASYPENRASSIHPTAVTLVSFAAETHPDGVLIRWVAADERTLRGYNLWRSSGPNGARVQVNAALIPAAVPGSLLGAAYTWLDKGAPAGEGLYYWLEEIDLSGARRVHGPAPAPRRAQDPTYLPWVAR